MSFLGTHVPHPCPLQDQPGGRTGVVGSNALEKQLAAESAWSGLQGWWGCAPTCVQKDTNANRKCDHCGVLWG